jgi:sulfhydrogenase subunit alpha
LSKIEGHTDLDVKVRNGKVEDINLKISENKRFYTQAIRGKDFKNLPLITSRICGTCSVAHLTCCTEAVEKALGLEISDQTRILRKLSLYGLMIRDHAMHLYLFVLPDILGKDSVLDFDKSQHKLIHDAFKVKGVGNSLSKLILGRAVHGIYSQIGGYTKIPDEKNIKKMIKELKSAREETLDIIEIMHDCDFKFERSRNFVALAPSDFSFLEGNIKSTSNLDIAEKDYSNHLQRVIIPYSQATGFELQKNEFMVGALARMNLNRKNINKKTKKDVKKFLNVFPSINVYHNNLAQAIEVLHSIDHSIEILQGNEFKNEKEIKLKAKNCEGVGVIEAPRGTLYYWIIMEKDGKIKYGNLVIPTAQNQIIMESDIKRLVQGMIHERKSKIQMEIEKLIRAYDPCMSCATHFLKVNWV